MPPAKKTANSKSPIKTVTKNDTKQQKPIIQEINSETVLGENLELNQLAKLVSDDSMSILSHCYNPNNNALILDYVIRRITTNKQGAAHLKLFNINWDYMVSKCNPKYILRPYERPDYHFPIYEFPESLPENQIGYLIDFKKMRYKTYPIILAVIEYLISAKSLITRARKPLIICYHIECCLGSYYYKFSELLEKYPEHYYWFLHGGTETPGLYKHKLLGMIQYYKVKLLGPSIIQSGATAATTTKNSTSKLLVGKHVIDKKNVEKQIWDLTGQDLLKYLIIRENALAGTANPGEYILHTLPICQILFGFLAKLKTLKHMNDLMVCYQTAYAINTLGYSISQFGKLLIKLIKWHRLSNNKYAPELISLSASTNYMRIINIFAEFDVGKYKDKTDQIPIFQQLMIELARMHLGGVTDNK